jgi:4-hydroxy-3-methylbut-2-enyl diphosphate reductase
MPKPPFTLYLAAPRGFCAGVDRAIKIVEMALRKWGAPVYVRHEIVHNRFVVDALRAQGAVFVEELDECPDDRPVVFSAHGVPKSVPAEAAHRQMIAVDATCPLVTKVHNEAARHHEAGVQMIYIGHDGHPETIGTMGQLPAGEVLLVETVADVAPLQVRDPAKLAFITQTTLSVDDTAEIAAALKAQFPAIHAPAHDDICYATTNRQAAVKAMAPRIDALSGDRGAEFLELAAAGRGGHRRRLRLLHAGPARHRHRLARAGHRPRRRPDRRRQRARSAGERGDRRLPRPL